MESKEMSARGFSDKASTGYILTVLSVLGVFAAISALLIAWPALSYLGAKLI